MNARFMNKTSFAYFCSCATAIMLLGVLTAGCSKKSPAPAASAPAPAEATTDTVRAPATAAAAASSPAVGNQQLAEAKAAMQAKNYEKAAMVLAKPPQTADQAVAYNRAKGALAQQVMAAAAAGDPQAKAVLEKMRQDALYHR
jgi:hypothetical protein